MPGTSHSISMISTIADSHVQDLFLSIITFNVPIQLLHELQTCVNVHTCISDFFHALSKLVG